MLKCRIYIGGAAMYKIKFILLVFGFLATAACKVAEVPEAYKFKPGEIRNNLYGSWTEVSFILPGLTTASVVSGELLAMNKDSMYLLTADGKVQPVEISAIATAALCTHKKQTGNYFFISLLFSIPSFMGMISLPEHAGEFFIVGTFVYGHGLIMVLKEEAFNRNFLIYPNKHSLIHFNAFSRYPAGMTRNIDFSQLTLKKGP